MSHNPLACQEAPSNLQNDKFEGRKHDCDAADGEKKVKNQSIPIPIRKLTCGMFGIDLLIVKQNPKPYQATLHDCCHVNRGVVTLEFF
jgi:hypothetical protein